MRNEMDKDIQKLRSKLSVSHPKDAPLFCESIPDNLRVVSRQYELHNIHSFHNLRIAFICHGWSETFQEDVVVKMIPPYLSTYASESAGYKRLSNDYMCPVLAFEDSLNTLILPKLMSPGDAGGEPSGMDGLLAAVGNETIPYINNKDGTPTYEDIYQQTVEMAGSHASYMNMKDRDFPTAACSQLWEQYFSRSPLYISHGDIHTGNLLRDRNGRLLAIDPLAYASPYPFRFTRYILVPSLFDHHNIKDLDARFQHALQYCHGCTEEELRQAIVIDCHFLMASLLVQSDRHDFIRDNVIPLMHTVFNHFSTQ